MEVIVDFEVTKIQCMQFEVRILRETRRVSLNDWALSLLTPEEGRLLQMLSARLTDTDVAVGRIHYSELASGVGGVLCREGARKTTAQERGRESYIGDAMEKISGESRKPCLYSAWSSYLSADRRF